MTPDEMRQIVREELHAKRHIDDERHSAHHDYLERQMARDERREKLWQQFRMSFIGGVALAVVAGLGWIGKLVIDAIQRGQS